MPYYESVFIARQDVSAGQVDGIADAFGELIGSHGGRITKREYWGLRNLAYRIKKNRKGHFVLFNIDAPSAAVQEFERNMRLHEDILRYLTIRLDELDDTPSAMMQGRSRERAARERRDREERPAAEAKGAPEGDEKEAKKPERKTRQKTEKKAEEETEKKAEKKTEKKAEAKADKKADGETKKKAEGETEKKADKKSGKKPAKEPEAAPDETAKEEG